MEFFNKEKNILVLGDSNVGKTSLIDQYVVNKQSAISAGISFKSDVHVKKMFVNNCKLQMQIWDLNAWNKQYNEWDTVFFRNMKCCILVFDVTSPTSFQRLDSWLQKFIQLADPPQNFPFVLVGNKVDLGNRKISTQQALNWCKKYNMPYFETTKDDDSKVEHVFMTIANNFSKDVPNEQPVLANKIKIYKSNNKQINK